MDPELVKKIKEQQQKIDKIYISVEKTRRYFQFTLILTIAFFILPLIASIFIVPMAIDSYNTILKDIGGLNF